MGTTGTRESALSARNGIGRLFRMRVLRNAGLIVLIMPSLVYALVFMYQPMFGILIAFKDFKASLGILGSPWTSSHGMKYFLQFFQAYSFPTIVRNTLMLSLYTLAASFPFPIVFALLLNHLELPRMKRVVQTVAYAPHFISTVVLVGVLFIFLAPSSGLVNNMLSSLGFRKVNFMNSPSVFPHVYVWSYIWQHTGWNSIIYIAALSAISPELHEAAVVDGATKTQRIRYVDLPGLMPTAVILLILNTGSVMSVGFEKVYLMQNNGNIAVSEVISTYIYKVGLLNAQFSMSTAMGLFNSIVNFCMLALVNLIARRVGETSLW
jgi:putative aldouronate transport system permease protein